MAARVIVAVAGMEGALPSVIGGLVSVPVIAVPTSVGYGASFGGLTALMAMLNSCASGVSVVGWDSLRYFWKPRTPQGLADDLDRVMRYYAAHWHKTDVVLVGYSQGADVLPFAINRLPPASRQLVIYSVMMGLGTNASFEFHVGNWLGGESDAIPIQPEAARLQPAKTLCIYGENEKDSLCPKLAPDSVEAHVMSGGHHFDGAYDDLAALILEHLEK